AKPVPAQLGLARALGAAGDTAHAAGILKTALASDPKFVDGWVYLGQLQRAGGDLSGARASFDKALALSPGNGPARLEHASLLIALDDLTAAEAEIATILTDNPQDPLGNYLKALAYANRQNYRAAEISLQKMRGGLYAYSPAIYLLAEINLAQDQLAQADDNATRNLARAIAFLKGAIGANPNSLRLLGLLGEAYVRDGQKDAAAAILDRFAALA